MTSPSKLTDTNLKGSVQKADMAGIPENALNICKEYGYITAGLSHEVWSLAITNDLDHLVAVD